MEKAVSIVLINKDGLTLGVSRKDNHNDFSLIGGKVDPEDEDDIIKAAIRETKEETGLDITNLQMIFAIHKDTRMQFTFLADYSGDIKYDEPHMVKWVPFDVILGGSFGKFNKLVAQSLDSMGISFQRTIDVKQLESELKEYVKTHVKEGYVKPFTFSHISKCRNAFCNDVTYELYFDEDIDEEFVDEGAYEEGFELIGQKYHVSIKYPTDYWGK